MAEIDDARQELRRIEGDLRKTTREVNGAIDRLQRLRTARAYETRTANPRDPATRTRLAALDAQIAAADRDLTTQREAVGEIRRKFADAIDLFGRLADPTVAASQLTGDTPLLLLPVRMETRFADNELWVRVYPDQWAVDAFEEQLSDTEVQSARQFWGEWWRAGGDIDRRRTAWRGLVGSHGSGRGGWITQQYRPINPGEEPVRASPDEIILIVVGNTPLPAAERAAVSAFWRDAWRAVGDLAASDAARAALNAAIGPARAGVVASNPPFNFEDVPADGDRAGAVAFAFCDVPAAAPGTTKLTSWTEGARADLLPDRFVLLGFNGRTEVLRAIGNPVPPALLVGPDPSAADANQLRLEDGELIVPDDLGWMFDFEAAIKVGMGFRVPLDRVTRRGVDRLFAIGLRVADSPGESQKAIERLLHHHHHSRTGLALVPQGTPTNNTEQAGSGFDRADDADASYEWWFGDSPGLVDQDRWSRKRDGQWLAETIGLDPAIFATVPGARGTDQAEARAANTAVWPATWGYFLETMMHPVFTDQTIESVRAFFTGFVSGRGLIPAIRIGRQPYGILPTTVLSKLSLVATDDGLLDGRFLKRLSTLIAGIAEQWEPLAAAVPHAGSGGDPQQTLLDVIALHPTSVEYHQRYAESLEDLFNRLEFDNLGVDFYNALGAVLAIPRARDLLADLGWSGADPDILEKVFHGAQHKLAGPFIDDRPLSEIDPVRAYTDDGRNYLQWLVDAAGTSLEVLRREQGFSGNRKPKALLYMMLRHALLLAWRDASLRFRREADVIDDAGLQLARREGAFVHVAEATGSESGFHALYTPERRVTGNDRTTLAEFIPRRLFERAGRHLRATIDAIALLRGVPTARLERIFAEHLDCCGFRLDAWRLGLVHHRLLGMRGVRDGDAAAPKQGVHVGAYGWLENVRPEPRRLEPVRLAGELEETFADPADPPLMRDPTNGGFVHAPSLNHAATAAVLRSGYLANATPAQPGLMAINISSERMRLATSIIQGIRHGQTLGALLGYRLERGLHDRHTVAEVDRFIHELRRVFPSPGDRDGRQVVDGLDLVNYINRHGIRTYPFGRTDLPAPSSTEGAAIDLEVARLLDVHDAVADLALAEGVHQAVLGNIDRSAATLDAYSKGGFPPEPAVLETPRSGITLTQRFGVHLRSGLDHTVSPVDDVPMTPRATAEPAVNDLLAHLLPSPADVVVRASWLDREDIEHEREISQADLELQPIDLLHVLQLGGQAMGEMDERIVGLVESGAALPPDVAARVTVHYTERIPGRITLFEVAPLVGHLRTLFMRTRPLRATDVLPGNDARRGIDEAAAQAHRERPAAVLAALHDWRTDANDLAGDLDALLADTTANRAAILAGVDAFVDRTIALQRQAAAFALPACGSGDIRQRRYDAFAQVLRLVDDTIARWTRRLADADAQLAADAALPTNASDEDRNRLLLLAERAISTSRTDPLPADADAYRTIVTGKRGLFAAKLFDLDAIRPAAISLTGTLADAAALLPLAPFDDTPFDLTAAENAVVDCTTYLRSRLEVILTEASKRIAQATQHLADHDAGVPGQPRANAIIAATKALLGNDAIVVPEFALPAALADEWDAAVAWSRTGQLTTHLATTRPYAIDDWLHGVARVREKVQAWEQAGLLAGVLGSPEPALLPIQLPHASEPWLALELPNAFTIAGDRTMYTAHYPVAFDKTAAQCGVLVDEWTETIPGEIETTGIAFHHDSPDCEAPQAMLLVVPPSPTERWQWQDIVDTLHETLDFARSRAIEPEQVDTTPFASFLPATVMAATVHGISIATNLAVNNGLLRALGADDA